MMFSRRTVAAVVTAALALATPLAVTHRPAGHSAAAANPAPPTGFTAHDAAVNGIRMHYVIGGHGPTLVLLHGYPETSYEWFGLLPALGRSYTVIAPDLRGAGGSSAPAGGYDKVTMAADVHALLASLGRATGVNLVGHDIGTMVAYAYAATYRDSVRKLALTEAPIPDLTVYSYPSLTPNGPGFWNFGFFSLTNGLPENTVNGHEQQWVSGFIDWLAVNKSVVADSPVYADALRDDAHLRASFEWFRAFGTDNADVARLGTAKLTIPVLAVGADHSLGASVAQQDRSYAKNVQAAVVPDSGHWIWEEQPAYMTKLLLDFLK
jgi:pimeloyl-ACP methyl ester carboxylesterase